MQGTALTYYPEATKPVVTNLISPPDLEWLKEQVGGYIELIPWFLCIEHEGETHDCIAFCNEEGKIHSLPYNATATALWDTAVKARKGGMGIKDASGGYMDFLVGPVVIVFGDAEFMGEM